MIPPIQQDETEHGRKAQGAEYNKLSTDEATITRKHTHLKEAVYVMFWGAVMANIKGKRSVASLAEERSGTAEDRGIYVERATLDD
ncbi:hypothetical protein N7455_005267 [Penicillium solitum]|uniref:uncharacterized protein n=1 Tax=Penicillium solitum TaxID=60172 RepID=UPI0032C411E2|nr:hypothetical protein N7455_005267 [Penicillium solitum]